MLINWNRFSVLKRVVFDLYNVSMKNIGLWESLQSVVSCTVFCLKLLNYECVWTWWTVWMESFLCKFSCDFVCALVRTCACMCMCALVRSMCLCKKNGLNLSICSRGLSPNVIGNIHFMGSCLSRHWCPIMCTFLQHIHLNNW